MLVDQLPLLTAIAFAAAALTATMFVGWLASRPDLYLLSWSLGLLPVLGGVVCFALNSDSFTVWMQFLAFALVIVGFGLIHIGALQFRGHPRPVRNVAMLCAILLVLTGAPFLVGLAGVGTIIGNLALAFMLSLSARQYWLSRQEARLPMVVNAVLYFGSALSFVPCALVLVLEQSWALTAVSANWAEDLNAATLIVGLTGIGAISLTLNQLRSADHHRREARTDSLTGLLNRRALFQSFVTTDLRPGSAVIMFDIDHFKAINDRHGHATGDAVIEAFGKLMGTELRHDDVSARLGGEEFCAVLLNLSSRSAAAVAERVRSAFEEVITQTALGPAGATVSAGVAVSGLDGEAFENVLRRADEALYAAKAGGRNCVHGPGLRLVA